MEIVSDLITWAVTIPCSWSTGLAWFSRRKPGRGVVGVPVVGVSGVVGVVGGAVPVSVVVSMLRPWTWLLMLAFPMADRLIFPLPVSPCMTGAMQVLLDEVLEVVVVGVVGVDVVGGVGVGGGVLGVGVGVDRVGVVLGLGVAVGRDLGELTIVSIDFILMALLLPIWTLESILVIGDGTLALIPLASILSNGLLIDILLLIRPSYWAMAFLAISLFSVGNLMSISFVVVRSDAGEAIAAGVGLGVGVGLVIGVGLDVGLDLGVRGEEVELVLVVLVTMVSLLLILIMLLLLVPTLASMLSVGVGTLALIPLASILSSGLLVAILLLILPS